MSAHVEGVREDAAIEVADDDAEGFARERAEAIETRRAVQSLIAAYEGNTHRLLTDLANQLGASIAYIDRTTVEAHLERALSDSEWSATNDQFTAMDFDNHVGDHGSFRTDWIEGVLAQAGVPGSGYTANGHPTESGAPGVDTA